MSKDKYNTCTTHFRIWKSGKKWLYSASILTLLVSEGVSSFPVLGELITHADTTTESTTSLNSTTQSSEDAVTNGETSTSNVTEGTTPKTSESEDSSEVTSSDSLNTTNNSVTSLTPMAPSKLSTVVAAAATTYNATDLIADGTITNVQVTWSIPDGTVTNSYPIPTQVTFTIAANSKLKAGDIINFGKVGYTGAKVGNATPSGAGYIMANGDAFDGATMYTLSSSYDNNLVQSSTLNLSFGNVGGSNGDTSSTTITSSYLNSTIHTTYTWTNVAPNPATNLTGYIINNTSNSSVAGKGSISFSQSNQQYMNSALNGSYDSTIGNAPTGNVVTIFHVSAEDASKIDLSSITYPGVGSYLYRLTPDGKNIAGNSGGSPSGAISSNQKIAFPAGGLSPDMNDADLTSSTIPNTSGWIKNSDGSLTFYVNQGSLSQSHPASSTDARAIVMSNDWSGTQDGVNQATSTLTDSQLNVFEVSGLAQFTFLTNDTSISNTIKVTGVAYSTDGYSKNLGTNTLNVAAAAGAQQGQSTIKVHYVDQSGNPIKGVSNNYGWPVGSATNPAGDTLNISSSSLQVLGYHLDTTQLPSNISGVNSTTGAVSNIAYPATAGTTLDVTYVYTQDTYTVSLSKVAQTIHYVDAKGKTLAPDSVQYVTFATVKDDQTGVAATYYQAENHTGDTVTSADGSLGTGWTTGTSTNFGAVANPAVSGSHWVSSSVTGDVSSETSAQAVTNQGPDQTVTVTYAPDTYTVSLSKVAQTIHYVDGSGNTVAPDATQYITFATVKNDQTGTETIYYQTGDQTGAKVTSADGTLRTGWTVGTSTNFGVVANPAVNGSHWVSSSVTGDTATETSAQAVTNKDTDQVITVTYAADTYTVNLSKVGQTIHYVDGSGNTVAPGSVQEITFATVKNDQTGVAATYYQAGNHTGDTVTSADGSLGTDWTVGSNANFEEVENPIISGLHWVSSSVADDVALKTRTQSVTSQDADQEITVTYAADTYTVSLSKVEQTIHYVDDKGNTVAPDSVQEITFATVKNDQTGTETIYYQTGDHTGEIITSMDGTLGTPWLEGKSTSFDAIANPTISGLHWTKSSMAGDTAGETSVQTVTSQSVDQVVTVTYTVDPVAKSDPVPITSEPISSKSAPIQGDSVQKAKENTSFPETGENQEGNSLIFGLGIVFLAIIGFVLAIKNRLRISQDD
ncbi:mucin-binding protein [Pseudolactococcus reticulitermitis]|uniref:Mub B2-like domain-containing protein n=1 Tax=Pseudolactococcus reticulitermitis TaxID=2025039 RepID=A0A224X8Q5_9LACT|nr:KxYKxGKxW signal peptide domain-containing protein [Lactococcus reticulitermitis]GAX47670.1 hypothetical protein RsY01_1271 [Lactococcus reticulitermitis]